MKALPPIPYWCCGFDWNRNTFRTTPACIARTSGSDPEWSRIVAIEDEQDERLFRHLTFDEQRARMARLRTEWAQEMMP